MLGHVRRRHAAPGRVLRRGHQRQPYQGESWFKLLCVAVRRSRSLVAFQGAEAVKLPDLRHVPPCSADSGRPGSVFDSAAGLFGFLADAARARSPLTGLGRNLALQNHFPRKIIPNRFVSK